MNPGQEDFAQLRRLLALKRHELPPPGYFDRFSREVILRIKAGEHARSEGFFGRLLGDVPWVTRLWGQVGIRPGLAAALGLAACALFVVGVVSTDNDPAEIGAAGLIPQPISGSLHLANWVPQETAFGRMTALDTPSTNGAVFAPRGNSLFEELRNLPQPQWRPEAVGYMIPAGN